MPTPPAVKQPKRGLCTSLTQTHALSVLLDWGTLPHHVILHIFRYLPLIDRARASSVCRRWNEVFHIPDLWRKFEFELNQSATSYFKSTHPDLIQQIIKKHAAHLQYVSFKVGSGSRRQTLCVSGSLCGGTRYIRQDCYPTLLSGLSLVITQTEIQNPSCN